MSDQNLEMEYIIKYMSEEIHKILEIDLNTDSFKVIKANDNELDPSMGFSNKFSIWLKQFVENGLVHPSDVNRFLGKQAGILGSSSAEMKASYLFM